jgi:hypothetical protein
MKESTLGFGIMKTMFDFLTARFGMKRHTIYRAAMAIENIFYGVAFIGLCLNCGPGLLPGIYAERAGELGDAEYKEIFEFTSIVASLLWSIPFNVFCLITCTIPYLIAQLLFITLGLIATVIHLEFRSWSKSDLYDSKEDDK